MKINSKKLISLLTVTIAVFILLFGLLSPNKAESATFSENLPAGYTAYPGQLVMGKSCSCATGTISGAPAPPPPCETDPCFGSSRTRYGSIATNIEGIYSPFCQEQYQAGFTVPPCFQLDGDDAMLISGSLSTVQGLSFYSFTLYQSFTYNSDFDSNYAATAASVNLSLNNANLKMGGDGKYVVIVTANTNTLNVVKKALRDSGVPDSIVNPYLVPASMTNVGSSDYPDQLSFIARFTAESQAEKQQIENFVQQGAPATKVAFIKGPGINGDVSVANLPKWEDKLVPNSVEYTRKLDQKQTMLEQAVTNSYTQKGYSLKARLTQNMIHVDPAACISTPEYCAYDSPDALYSAFPCDFAPGPVDTLGCTIRLEKDSQDVLMLLGVDHSLFVNKTLAAYLSFESKEDTGSLDGTFSFVGLYTQGSAQQYIASHNSANLYAVKIARSCGSGELYCAAVPYLGDTGTPEKTGFFILGRTYLGKLTATAPNPGNLVPATLLWFTKS